MIFLVTSITCGISKATKFYKKHNILQYIKTYFLNFNLYFDRLLPK